MARAFTAGLALVVVLAALTIAVTRPEPPAPPPATELASEVAPANAPGMPPSREDLIRAICTGYLATPVCVHDLMELYRACGTDGAHPRTPGCAAEVARVRRAGR